MKVKHLLVIFTVFGVCLVTLNSINSSPSGSSGQQEALAEKASRIRQSEERQRYEALRAKKKQEEEKNQPKSEDETTNDPKQVGNDDGNLNEKEQGRDNDSSTMETEVFDVEFSPGADPKIKKGAYEQAAVYTLSHEEITKALPNFPEDELTKRRMRKKEDYFLDWKHELPVWKPIPDAPTNTSLFQYPDLEAIQKYFPDAFFVADTPPTFYFPNFITDEEIEAIVNLAKGRMFRSQVQATEKNSATSEIRTSSQTWIREGLNPVVDDLFKRVKFITGIPKAEQLQVLHYDVGQKYVYHFDYLPGEIPTQRAATFFLYLNDVEEGGYTAFPDANNVGGYRPKCCDLDNPSLKVLPKKGNAVLWYNLHRDGKRSLEASHSGCPVIGGEKWGANVWLRVKNVYPYHY